MNAPLLFTKHIIDGNQHGPHLLISGGVHGDEFTPMAAIRRLVRRIDRTRLSGRLTLIPVVNEAAFMRGERTADDQLDLARICPGRKDGSISERVAYQLSELIRCADHYIDLHTGSRENTILPLAGYTLHSNDAVLDVQRRMARAFNLPIVWGTDPSLDGRTLSVARDAEVPAIYAEYLGGGTCDPQGIVDYVQGCLSVMAELEMIDESPVTSRVKHAVEDNRQGSGHMQAQNLSPIDGFFEPSVALGDSVAAGDPLGTVIGHGDHLATISAVEAGMVIGLRTFSRVLAGDFVAVVLRGDRRNQVA